MSADQIRLEMAARNVSTGLRIIELQREIIRLLKASQRDTAHVDAILKTMLEAQVTLEADLERIRSGLVMPKTGG